MLRITHVVAGLARQWGGPSYSVPALAAAVAQQNADVCLRSVHDHGDDPLEINNVRRITHLGARSPLSRALRASPDLKKALVADSRAGAILHVHGLWLMPNVYPAWAARRADGAARLVHAPRGMLGRAALEISPWKKKSFWWLLQRAALRAADCLHATSEAEYAEIRAVGLRNPVVIIPNGVDLPDLAGVQRHQGPESVALSLGRIHPKKGLDRLIRAWAQIEGEFPLWRLRIVGPAENGHDRKLLEIVRSVGARRISIELPVYGEAKIAVLRNADLFVLPTLNENFAMTVAEALAAEVPVVATKGAPWPGLESERCGWWIEHGVEPLAMALRSAMVLPRPELREAGARGRNWMERDYGWRRSAADMLRVYHWLNARSEPPAIVRFD